LVEHLWQPSVPFTSSPYFIHLSLKPKNNEDANKY
jgi:hypothetical protein